MAANEEKKERAPEGDPTHLINTNTCMLASISKLAFLTFGKEPCSSV